MQSWGRAWAGRVLGYMHGSSPGGESSFMGCFAFGLPDLKSLSRQTPLFWGEERMKGDFWRFLTQEKAVAKLGCLTRLGTNVSWVLLALKAFFIGPNQPLAILPWLPSWMWKAGPQEGLDGCLGCSCYAVTAPYLKKINPHTNPSGT